MKIFAILGLSGALAISLPAANAALPGTAPKAPLPNAPLPNARKAEIPTPETVFRWYQNQWFDEVIEGATKAIAASATPDPRLLYYRGRTFYSTGSFRAAEEDLAPLGDFRPFPRWTAASEIVAKVRAAKALVPPNVYQVKDEDGRARFLIYYGHDDAWTRAAIDALKDAYAANLQMIGFARPETPVLLFDDSADFAAFGAARAGRPQPGWAVGLGGSFGFYMRRLTPKDGSLSASALATLHTIVTHEYDHSIVNRFVGNDVFPKWMAEGLARCAADIVVPAQIERDEKKFARVWQNGGVLSFDQVSDRREFMAAMDEKFAPETPPEAVEKPAPEKNPAPETAAKSRVLDPYAQSHDMARYFLECLPPDGLGAFLIDLRAARDFDAVFESHVKLSPAQFYEKWLQHCRARLGDAPPATAPTALAPTTPATAP